MRLTFTKYQGTGNDFVILDNRDGKTELTNEQVKKLCDRRFGIGADGLMLLNAREGYDFAMKYYNADGRESTMCGNGGRCLTAFAAEAGIIKDKYTFIAIDGPHESLFDKNGWVRLKMMDVLAVQAYQLDTIINTGSPHYVREVSRVMDLNVFNEGQKIRYSHDFKEEGINVNFVELTHTGSLIVRTYERGVEDETLSCGTGVTASALAFSPVANGIHNIPIRTLGGDLAVQFEKKGSGHFENIWLCGPATLVFKGELAF